MLREELIQLETALAHDGDAASAHKIRQLRDKLQAGTFIVAFCGHFSAGKSTMINSLLGRAVLPSSPIPTSANLVTIENGAERVAVFRKGGGQFDIALSELDKLREYATDGETVESIQIHVPVDFLPEHVQLMDTPGIDSTDDAHKLATESALHLADLVIYTMDYNHVQSEVNFGFTKTLQEHGKAVWLVVNQIDKHNDFELPFDQYQNSVSSSFAAWGIKPDAIFYTSMLDPYHRLNQFAKLKAVVQQLFPGKQHLLHVSIVQSAKNVIEEHGNFLAVRNRSERERLLLILADTAEYDLPQLQEQTDELRRQIAEQNSVSQQLKAQMEDELYSLIQNATLTPFQTTELAGTYLESRRSGFRMGILFSGSKTEQERINRLQQLHADFSGKVSANLDWHIKDLLVKLAEQFGVNNEAYTNSVFEIHVDITPAMLADWVKEGALASQEYMYQYAKDISSEVKSIYRRIAAEYIERAVHLATSDSAEINEQLMAELQQAELLYGTAARLAALEQQEQAVTEQLLALVSNSDTAVDTITSNYGAAADTITSNYRIAADIADESNGTQLTEDTYATADGQADGDLPKFHKETIVLNSLPAAVEQKTSKSALTGTAVKLRTASAKIEHIPGMHVMSTLMRQRADRLEQNLFTVALFGAFSAGKSSFANALMGDMLLPVSPNPTTATINKILPPTAEWPHGSARVKVKSRADMAADIIASLAVFDLQTASLERDVMSGESDGFFADALRLIAGLDAHAVSPIAKPHFSFLKAVETGLAAMQDQLGMELPVDTLTFREYVAQESKACFVEWIELYHDNPLTAQGIMLIDTPGADSINARHTKVAFEYIKNADAVLFVTYYNHAFSNADREFLIQLGRVKDTFELDKMFFLLNAADLAADPAELNDVIAHVRRNLTVFGISAPRIYPVSSQLALLARLVQKGAMPSSAQVTYRKLTRTGEHDTLPDPGAAVDASGIRQFEQEFMAFTIEELTELAVQSGLADIRRALAALGEFIESAAQGEAVRAEKRHKLQQELAEAQRAIQAVEIESETRVIGKEVDELTYYVKQRLFLRYRDAFNECFSSSVLRDDAGNIKKQLLNSLQELLRFIAFDLAQEMRATAVRIEKQVNHSAERILAKMAEAAGTALAGCSLQPHQKASCLTPEFPEQMPDAEIARFSSVLSLYKNAKDFFERNAKAGMRDEIEKLLQDPVAAYLQHGSKILKQVYLEAFQSEIDLLTERVITETEEYAEGIAAALEMKLDIKELESTKAQLRSLL